MIVVPDGVARVVLGPIRLLDRSVTRRIAPTAGASAVVQDNVALFQLNGLAVQSLELRTHALRRYFMQGSGQPCRLTFAIYRLPAESHMVWLAPNGEAINQGAVVLGDAAAVLGEIEIERGGQVMGEHVQVGMGKLFHSSRRHSILSRMGPFGFFPTLALFALVYLVGLLAVRVWPERVRQVGHAMFEQPVKSFLVGFLCWLLLLPLALLLIVSVVGIPLIFLLPVMIFLAITMGTSAMALRVGEALPAGPGQRFVPPAAMGMGLLALLLLAFLPWLGASLLALLQFVALGAAVTSRMGRTLPPHVA